ncbi:MAG: hypothetical protein H6698_00080 [Myxococcales bacterium]|nr:hypothetical protein [Myxococcales bacterium]MCB9532709.1 hypothetical protein [Myxococcales bacterium]
MRVQWTVACLSVIASLSACASKSEEQRCDELEQWIEGREASLGYECATDLDCAVVWVRPDHPLAVNPHTSDVEEQRVLSEYQQTCGEIPASEGTLAAVCVVQVVQVLDPDNPGQVLDVESGRACVLRGTYTVPDTGVDTTDDADAGEDAADCGCERGSDCGAGEACVACECVPSGDCADACAQVFACDAEDALGVGATPSACVAGCEVAAPDLAGFANCLRGARGCEALLSCERAVP